VPVELLAAAPFPKLVVSGDHDKMFHAVCDMLREKLQAERLVFPGAGRSIPTLGGPVNAALAKFWSGTADSSSIR
jgi:hypothetical protein